VPKESSINIDKLVVDNRPDSEPSMINNDPPDTYKSEFIITVLLKNDSPSTTIVLNTSKDPVFLIVVASSSIPPLWSILPLKLIVPSNVIFPFNNDVLYDSNPLPNV